MVNGFNALQLALAGINDDSFKQGYQGGLARDTAKKKAETDAEAAQKAHDDALDKQAKDYELKNQNAGLESNRSMGIAQLLNRQHPNVPVSASGSGGVSIGGKDPLEGLLRQERVKNANDDRVNKQVETFGKRAEAQKIPASVEELASVQNALPPEGEEMKSYGPFMNAIPNWAVSAGEAAHLFPKGARAERSAMEAAKSMVRNPLYGSALTPHEARSFEEAFGAPIGGSEADVRRALQRMKDIPVSQLQNIQSTTSPEAVGRIKEQGGLTVEQVKAKLGSTTQDPRARLEELRRKKAGR